MMDSLHDMFHSGGDASAALLWGIPGPGQVAARIAIAAAMVACNGSCGDCERP
jgi:hypothetical protein